ncbi:MAG: hypothetical protein K0S11_789 [Gammaproteobacteria bacterium]|nr:hypothetical protein [Gammaproteobacteria bacterium]
MQPMKKQLSNTQGYSAQDNELWNSCLNSPESEKIKEVNRLQQEGKILEARSILIEILDSMLAKQHITEQPSVIIYLTYLADSYLKTSCSSFTSQSIKTADFEAEYIKPLQLYCLASHLACQSKLDEPFSEGLLYKIINLINQYILAEFNKESILTTAELQGFRERLRKNQELNIDEQPIDTQTITSALKGLFAELIEKAFALSGQREGNKLGNYVFIGLGSLSRSEMTPYSDLEFGLLIENKNKCGIFEKIVRLLHLLVIALGQTAVDDKLFTDNQETKLKPYFKNKLFIPKGFSFDGAWRTPLGRKSFNYDRHPFKLLGTVDELVSFVKDDGSFNRDYLFFSQLSQVDIISGDLEIYANYHRQLDCYLTDEKDNKNKKVLKTFKDNLEKLRPQLKTIKDYEKILQNHNIDAQTAQPENLSFSLKHDLHRFLERTIDALHLYHYAALEKKDRNGDLTTKAKIEALCQAELFNIDLGKQLKQLLNDLIKYRCLAYQHYQGQIENAQLVLEQSEHSQPAQNTEPVALYKIAGQKLFQQYGFLRNFYDKACQFINFCEKKTEENPWSTAIDNVDPRGQADAYYRDKDYESARRWYWDVIRLPNQHYKHHDYERLGKIYLKLSEYENAVCQFKAAYQFLQSHSQHESRNLKQLTRYKLLAGVAKNAQAMAHGRGDENSYQMAQAHYEEALKDCEELLKVTENLETALTRKEEPGYFTCASRKGDVQLATLWYKLSECHLRLGDYYYINDKQDTINYQIAKRYFKLYVKEAAKLNEPQLEKMQHYLDALNSMVEEMYLEQLSKRLANDTYKEILNHGIDYYRYGLDKMNKHLKEERYKNIKTNFQNKLGKYEPIPNIESMDNANRMVPRNYHPRLYKPAETSSQQAPASLNQFQRYKEAFSNEIAKIKQVIEDYKTRCANDTKIAKQYPTTNNLANIISELDGMSQAIKDLTCFSEFNGLRTRIKQIKNLIGRKFINVEEFKNLFFQLKNQYLIFCKNIVKDTYALKIAEPTCGRHNLGSILLELSTQMDNDERYLTEASAYYYHHYISEDDAKFNFASDIDSILGHLTEASIITDENRQALTERIKQLRDKNVAKNDCILLFLTPALHLLKIDQTFECHEPHTINYLITKVKSENLHLYLLNICWLDSNLLTDAKKNQSTQLFNFEEKVYIASLYDLIKNIFLHFYSEVQPQEIDELLSDLAEQMSANVSGNNGITFSI